MMSRMPLTKKLQMRNHCAKIAKSSYRLTGLAVFILVAMLLPGCERKVKVAGIKTDTMNYYAARQSGRNWCWAACIQMVLAARGIDLSQEQIAQRTFGNTMDRPAGIDAVCANLDGWAVKRDGKPSQLTALMGLGPPRLDLMIENFQNQVPIVVYLEPPDRGVGHAVVVTAVEYRDDGPTPQILNITVRDPDPFFAGTMGKRMLMPEEYANIGAFVIVKEH